MGGVVSRWGEIKSQMRAVDLSLSALLNDARPLGQDEEGQLVLGFKHNFHRGKFNTPENRAALERLMSKLLGSSLRIRCELEKDWSGSASGSMPPAPPASPAPSAVARSFQPPQDPLESDPLIQRAKTELGATPKILE